MHCPKVQVKLLFDFCQRRYVDSVRNSNLKNAIAWASRCAILSDEYFNLTGRELLPVE